MPQRKQETFTVEEIPITIEDRCEELGLEFNPSIQYNLEKLFPKIEGWGWKSQVRKKYQLLKNVEPLLKECLSPTEEVLYITKGNRYSFIEQYMMGIWAYSLNQTLFVLTNVRLLMFRCNSKGKPKKTFWMVYYNQIAKHKRTWTGVLELKLSDRKKLHFTGINKQDYRQMKEIVIDSTQLMKEKAFEPVVSQSLENLCSHCLDRVPKAEYRCESCGTQFWSPKELALRSFCFPSWGDFLMGHTLLAIVELFGSITAWSILLVGLFSFLSVGNPEGLIIGLVLFLLFNGIDSLLTYHVASKGLHPKAIT